MTACICARITRRPRIPLSAVFLVALPVFAIGLAGALLMRDLPLRTND
jgi:hypothetical protein